MFAGKTTGDTVFLALTTLTTAGKPPIPPGNGRARQPDLPKEEFSGPGFRFVRYFLLLILVVVGAIGWPGFR